MLTFAEIRTFLQRVKDDEGAEYNFDAIIERLGEYKRDRNRAQGGRIMLSSARRDVVRWVYKVTSIQLERCSDCQLWRDGDKGTRGYCPDCADNYGDCSDCGEFTHSDHITYIECNSHNVCANCEENYRHCRECETQSHRENMYSRGRYLYCEDCFNEHESGDDDESESSPPGACTVYEYGTKAPRVFKRKWLDVPGQATDLHGNGRSKSPTLWLGFELEVVARGEKHTAARECNEAFAGRGILANDSSIKEERDGFELISIPATLEYHQTQWGRAFFDKVQKAVTAWPHHTCGMHVHLSRAALTPLQIGRALVFLNDPNCKSFVEHVAGRGANDYTRVAKKKISDALPTLLRDKFHSVQAHCGQRANYVHSFPSNADDPHDDRYNAMNLTNGDTVEIRIFRANCAEIGFLKNIEFCHALFTWAQTVSNIALSVPVFLRYVEENRGRYPNLAQWCQRERYFTSRHTFVEPREMTDKE